MPLQPCFKSILMLNLYLISIRVVDMDVKRGMVLIRNPMRKEEAPREFTFDAVYDWK